MGRRERERQRETQREGKKEGEKKNGKKKEEERERKGRRKRGAGDEGENRRGVSVLGRDWGMILISMAAFGWLEGWGSLQVLLCCVNRKKDDSVFLPLQQYANQPLGPSLVWEAGQPMSLGA